MAPLSSFPTGLHAVSDSLIALAYYAIAVLLVYIVRQRSDLPRQCCWWLGTFLVAYGTIHLMEVWTIWHPVYWLSGILKAIVALISLYTMAKLLQLLPQVLTLPSSAQLEMANQNLAAAISNRQKLEAALEDSETRFRSIFETTDIGIALIDMDGQDVETNPALKRMLGGNETKLELKARVEENIEENPELSEAVLTQLESQIYTNPFTKIFPNSLEEYYHKPKRYLGRGGQLLWGRDYYQMEKRYLGKDGQMLWCLVTIFVVRDAGGKPKFGIRMLEDITERKQAVKAIQEYQEHLEKEVGERTAELTTVNEQLAWEANHDALTGLFNRRKFEQHLHESISSAQQQNCQHTLCYLDLDRFKIVNDTCGHIAGDELLRQVSTMLQNQVRKTDMLARLGGDEFGLLLYKCDIEQAMPIVQGMHKSVQKFRFAWEDKLFTIGVSIGLLIINSKSENIDSVLGAADIACYTAKSQGRDRIYVYQSEKFEELQHLPIS